MTQDGGINLLATKTAVLESMVDKLRSESGKAAIKDVLKVVAALIESREKVTLAYNVVAHHVKGVNRKTDEMAPQIVTADAVTQSPCWWDIAGPPQQKRDRAATADNVGVTAEMPPPKWTEVVRKGRSKGQTPLTAATTEKVVKTKPAQQQRTRTRPLAILVDVSREDFPELAKKIRGEACRDIIGNRVVGMRQAKSGGLLIEVRGNTEDVSAVRAEIARSAGADIGVRTLQQRELLEVRDLDQWSDGPEVLAAIASATGCDTGVLRLAGLRKRYGGAQLALVSAPKEVTQAILKQGRLRVGMVSCSVRICDEKIRCFRCLAYGHTAKDCSGPDRTECCRRCGQNGHFAKVCAATQDDALLFAKSLVAIGQTSRDGVTAAVVNTQPQ